MCPVAVERSGGKQVNKRWISRFSQRACQADLRGKVKHDWIVCMKGY